MAEAGNVSTATRRTLTFEAWRAEGMARFGENTMRWAWVCPACGHRATAQDWVDAGAPQAAVAFSCVGRWLKGCSTFAFSGDPGPCNYAGGGLFLLNPVTVEFPDGVTLQAFEFADADDAQGGT